MGALRIKGLVKFTNRVRVELSGPISADRKTQLRGEVSEIIRQVDGLVADHGTHIDRLPAPTRRAYQFLAALDLTALPTADGTEHHDAPRRPIGRTRLVGARAFWEDVLQQLASATSPDERDDLFDSIRSAHERTERSLQEQSIRLGELTNYSRAFRGWLAFFSERTRFDAYVRAIETARPVFDDALGRSGRFLPPARIEFQGLRGLFRLRGYRDGTRVILPVPMIVFSRERFGQLAEAAVSSRRTQQVMAAIADEAYQDIQAELEALSGIEDQTAGVHRDLAASFDRVNERYFGGGMDRPRLTWSRSFTGRKFGHYDFVRDAIMISCSLDRACVPEPALDFVMYHELLHKELGESWANGRATAHTPEFKRRERLFDGFREAEGTLKRIAMGRL